MPELAELRLTADYINKSANGLKFVNIKKNPVHKGKDIEVPFKFFRISAERLEFSNSSSLTRQVSSS